MKARTKIKILELLESPEAVSIQIGVEMLKKFNLQDCYVLLDSLELKTGTTDYTHAFRKRILFSLFPCNQFLRDREGPAYALWEHEIRDWVLLDPLAVHDPSWKLRLPKDQQWSWTIKWCEILGIELYEG
jgi:hypothetical protein